LPRPFSGIFRVGPEIFPRFRRSIYIAVTTRKGVGGRTLGQVLRDAYDLLHEGEIVLFAFLGWGLVPIAENFYDLCANATLEAQLDDGGEIEIADEGMDGSDVGGAVPGEAYAELTSWDDDKVNDRIRDERKGTDMSPPSRGKLSRETIVPFRQTRIFQVVNHIGQASRIGLSVIAVDYVALVARKFGYNPWNVMEGISRIYSKIAFTGWAAYRFKLLKSYAFDSVIPGDRGKLHVFDQLLDGLICLGWVFSMLNYLEVQTGIAITVRRRRSTSRHRTWPATALAFLLLTCMSLICQFSRYSALAQQERW
jgi:hypothetical protein